LQKKFINQGNAARRQMNDPASMSTTKATGWITIKN
jgi:hypothetical protein